MDLPVLASAQRAAADRRHQAVPGDAPDDRHVRVSAHAEAVLRQGVVRQVQARGRHAHHDCMARQLAWQGITAASGQPTATSCQPLCSACEHAPKWIDWGL